MIFTDTRCCTLHQHTCAPDNLSEWRCSVKSMISPCSAVISKMRFCSTCSGADPDLTPMSATTIYAGISSRAFQCSCTATYDSQSYCCAEHDAAEAAVDIGAELACMQKKEVRQQAPVEWLTTLVPNRCSCKYCNSTHAQE